MTDLLKRIDEGLETRRMAIYTNAVPKVFRGGENWHVWKFYIWPQYREAFKALIEDAYRQYTQCQGTTSGKPLVKNNALIESGTGWTWSEWKEWIDEKP